MLPILWKRKQDDLELQRNFDRFFDEFWGGDFPSLFKLQDVSWTPRVDIEETDKAYIVQADMPGVKKEDIKVSLHNNTLSIHGDRKYENDKKSKNQHKSERFYGSFSRSFSLPEWIIENDISAEYSNGVLRVTLPKSEKAQAKDIKIN